MTNVTVWLDVRLIRNNTSPGKCARTSRNDERIGNEIVFLDRSPRSAIVFKLAFTSTPESNLKYVGYEFRNHSASTWKRGEVELNLRRRFRTFRRNYIFRQKREKQLFRYLERSKRTRPALLGDDLHFKRIYGKAFRTAFLNLSNGSYDRSLDEFSRRNYNLHASIKIVIIGYRR